MGKNFFCKAPVSYYEFRQQCQSLRIFAFVGVCGGCVFSLFWNPPKSSYWSHGLGLQKVLFGASSPPIFLTEKVEHATDVPDVYRQLTTIRRLENAGSDSEEE